MGRVHEERVDEWTYNAEENGSPATISPTIGSNDMHILFGHAICAGDEREEWNRLSLTMPSDGREGWVQLKQTSLPFDVCLRFIISSFPAIFEAGFFFHFRTIIPSSCMTPCA